ncbi:IclR family transcriptional regulator [Salipiger sp. PrR002]|uniref:IclR family transcriptional regulator n=1 Tax=Salipiger sp. PrR002 TaxID=2706489 RepID=UPI0013BA9AFA|nr:IclR family transcriptional regulator [Salipiger sp. PrR002]NDW01893.1 IclR family transcriptional regulator [Salipiger sp. PrR002]NDW59077.1 IclR family transcriptional regulator [Salipiger sp. PrR004]
MIKSVEKAFRLLEILSEAREPMRLRDVSAAAEMTRSNALRMLQTLQELGYVRQAEGSSLYEMSLKAFQIGASRVSQDGLVTAAHPIVQELADKVEANVLLSVRDGAHCVVVDRIESRAFVRTFAHLGAREPLQAVSAGKVLLAYSSAAVFEMVAANLAPLTPRTIVTREALEAEMEKVRAQGFATTEGEVKQDAKGIAVPVRGRLGDVVAALTASGPLAQMSDEELHRYVALLRDHAARIEAAWPGGLNQG